MQIFILILFCVAIAALIYFSHKSEQRKKKQLQDELNALSKAETDYKKGLSELKMMPTNADLKETVLKLGREYSGLTRKFQGINGISVVDEVGIMNDINAACAAATSVAPEVKRETKQTVEQRLEKLSELREKFNQRRRIRNAKAENFRRNLIWISANEIGDSIKPRA